jgi:hypothetical protein
MQRLRRWFWDTWEPGREWLGLVSFVGAMVCAVLWLWDSRLGSPGQTGFAFSSAGFYYAVWYSDPRKRVLVRGLALVWLAFGMIGPMAALARFLGLR